MALNKCIINIIIIIIIIIITTIIIKNYWPLKHLEHSPNVCGDLYDTETAQSISQSLF